MELTFFIAALTVFWICDQNSIETPVFWLFLSSVKASSVSHSASLPMCRLGVARGQEVIQGRQLTPVFPMPCKYPDQH